MSLSGPQNLTGSVRELIRAAFPQGSNEIPIELEDRSDFTNLAVSCVVDGEYFGYVEQGIGSDSTRDVILIRLAKVALVKALREADSVINMPWGILTGIRPTKIVHRLIDQGMAKDKIKDILATEYLIVPEKIELVCDVAYLQRDYLPMNTKLHDYVCVYIGIPFCPSVCTYCSFGSSAQIGGLKEYLVGLKQEIAALGTALTQRGIRIQALYIGGGTPTILEAQELSSLLEQCKAHLPCSELFELTVEGGRADTLNEEKFDVMLEAGVNRISINPQTMVADTLRTIGRNHTPEQVEQSFSLARKLGFKNINMDIIMGLPHESAADFRYTLQKITAMKPDSLTVHSLAVKRASRLITENKHEFFSNDGIIMQNAAADAAISMGMTPYYLYRQKRIYANMENTGYAIPSKESLYNISIMEERQTIFGLGAGATTKIVNPLNWNLQNFQNPKNIPTYLNKWPENMAISLRCLDGFEEE